MVLPKGKLFKNGFIENHGTSNFRRAGVGLPGIGHENPQENPAKSA